MSDIAKLTVALYANSAQFTSELKKSQKSAKTWSDSISKTVSVAAKATAGAATAAAGALLLVYNQQAAIIDQTAKFADRIGISTEALTQFRHASELTGVGTKNLDMSLQRMTRRIAEAAQGSGEAVSALQQLGLDAQQLGEMTPDEQLYQLADAFTEVEGQSERVRLAFKLFDSEGVGMVNMLAGGADGLHAMAEEADYLGITLSRVDAAKVEMANDAMYKVGATTTAVKQQITTQLAPIVAALADEFLNYSQQFGGMNNMIAEGIHTTTQGVGIMADSLRGVQLIVEGLTVVWEGFRIGFMVASQAITTGLHELGRFIFNVVISPLQTALDLAGNFSDEAAKMAASLRQFSNMPAPQLFDASTVNQAQLDLNQAIWELRSLASEPLPSEGIEAWYQNTKSKFDQLAKDYAASINYNQPNNKPPEGETSTNKEDKSVTAFRAATNQMQVEWQRRLALQAAGEQQAAAQESFAYQDRMAKLSQQFQAAYEASANNQELQQALENEYFDNRELLWTEHQANLTLIEAEQLAAREEQNKGFWQRYSESLQENMTNMDELTANMLNTFSRNMGNAFESVIFDSQSLGDAFKNMAEGMSRSVINALGQMAGQWLAYQAVQLLVGKTTAVAGAAGLAANAQAASLQAGLNAFASTAAIPIVGPVAAPGAMAAALAVTTPIAASISALAAGGVAGMAHSGISSVPREGTWLLDKGERVYTNDSAKQLDQMYSAVMSGQSGKSGGSGDVVVKIENAPAGYVAETAEAQEDEFGRKVIRILLQDQQQGGDVTSGYQTMWGLQRQGRF